MESKGLIQISDAVYLSEVIDKVLAAQPKEVEQYKAGKTKLQGFFAG